MIFKQFTLDSADELLPYIEKCPYLGSDFTLGYLLMWYKELNIQYCIIKDTFVLRYDLDDLASFTFPFGIHAHEVLMELIEFVKENNLPLRFYGIDEETINLINHDDLFHNINLSYDIRWSDYIYSFKDVLTFSGKKYKGHYYHDQKNGYGEFYWPNGKIYKGYWKHGKQNGEGEFFDVKENKWKKGFWADGRRVRWEIEK